MSRVVRTGRGITILLAALLVVPPGAWAESHDEQESDAAQDDLVVFSKGAPQARPEPGQALVYALRPAKLGFAVKSWLFVDDAVLGVNKGDSCFAAHVAPGTHVVWSKSENVDAMELTLEAGATYYLQQRVRFGGIKARTKLELLAAEDGPAILAKCNRQSSLTEAGRKRGAELALEHRDATVEDLERRAQKAQAKGE